MSRRAKVIFVAVAVAAVLVIAFTLLTLNAQLGPTHSISR